MKTKIYKQNFIISWRAPAGQNNTLNITFDKGQLHFVEQSSPALQFSYIRVIWGKELREFNFNI